MEYVFPVKVVESTAESGVENLLVKKSVQIGIREEKTTVLTKNQYVILDFGRELSGGVRILTLKAKGANRVRLRFGESVSEACSTVGVKGACNDHSNRDFYVELRNYSDMRFGNTGFRFLRIDAPNEECALAFKAVVAESTADERAEVGSFVCNDERVNEIWRTAAYTLRLCLQNGYFWDGVKRDRLVWIGDLYPEMRAAHCLFGRVAETDNSLTFAREETPVGEWMGWIPNYSVWWLYILCEEYAEWGDLETVQKHLPYARELIKYLSTFITEEGETTFQKDFIDWASYYSEGEPLVKKADSHSGTFYFLKTAFSRILEVFRSIGEDVGVLESIVERLSKRQVQVEQYKQIAALGVLAGDVSENNKRLVLEGGAAGLSTFMSYQILTAMARVGEYDQALACMKAYYGKMLELGATTFWEDFDLAWAENAGSILELPKDGQKDIHGDFGRYCYTGYRHSLCHGWSAGVIPYLMETVAGLQKDAEGKLQIRPHLSGLEWVKATYPTKDGVLEVEHRRAENGEVQTTVKKNRAKSR